MIVLDTSVLIEGIGAGGRMRGEFRTAIAGGERLVLPALVLFEWLRGPRVPEELAAQEALFPTDQALDFSADEARIAAHLYRELPHPRGREIDLAIAASALVWRCPLWTLNVADFEDIPGLHLVR
ncbi:MAG: type II toxin-antitoxin system VapC family toxin [Longimicrobiales bacterium]|nr:type II toxin-antitoxin system VapC family toxin [Longimicrobiales bacterium]